MRRFISLISLLTVLITGSAFTLACAFACLDPLPEQIAFSHCHEHEKTSSTKNWPSEAIQGSSPVCPLIAVFENRPATILNSIAGSSSFKQPMLLKLLPIEWEQPKNRPVFLSKVSPTAFPPPEPRLPLYLKNPVLRL